MMSNICLYCICRHTCKLTEPILTTCPIFPEPPQEPSTHEQLILPWDSLEGTDGGGRN